MKQALIIGSTVADVTVRLPHLPVTGEDVIVESQSMSLGWRYGWGYDGEYGWECGCRCRERCR